MDVKVDMNKAYNRVEWDFLIEILKRIGFEGKWIGWIWECISSISYNIIVNGKKSNTVCPSRSLRQGDLLSSYLFLFVIDVLSRLIGNAIECKSLAGIKLVAIVAIC